MKLELRDSNGDLIGSHSIEMDGSDPAVEEYSLKIRAKNLYRDFLFKRGLWNKENHAKLGGTYWHG